MVTMASRPPSRADGRGFFSVATYKATVMAVLLFGSETWNLAPSSLKRLEGFHHWAAWRMAGKQPRLNPDGSWTYPDTEAVMKEVGLRSISHYVEVWRQHVFNFIVN